MPWGSGFRNRAFTSPGIRMKLPGFNGTSFAAEAQKAFKRMTKKQKEGPEGQRLRAALKGMQCQEN